MKDKKIAQMFYALADLAQNAGMEFSLSLEDNATDIKVLNGALSNNQSTARCLTLRCWRPDPADAAAADEETDDGEAEK